MWGKRFRLRGSGPPRPAAPGWSLDDELVRFGTAVGGRPAGIPWTLRHACEGTLVFGGTGSGKSSGSGRTLALAMLRRGFGGLVLCAKPDEARVWRAYARETGREGDLVLFSPESGEKFNFLDYELRRAGRGAGLTENVVAVLMQCAGAGGSSGGGEDGEIWTKAMRQLLRNAIDLCRLADRPLTMELIHGIALDPAAARELLALAGTAALGESALGDLHAVRRYFLTEWERMAERTRSGVLMNLTAVCDPFFRGVLRDLFCGATTLTPEDAFSGGIIVIDLPVKTFNELGQYAAVIWKFLFQRAAERRENPDRPLFIHADECQFFTTPTDALFQSTARGCRTATVYLTQNLPGLRAGMGGGSAASLRADALLGNLQTKIFHRNADPETNRWAAETLTRGLRTRGSASGGVSLGERGPPRPQAGSSRQEVWEFEAAPREFLGLAPGGPESDYVVTALLFQGGRIFPNGRHLIEVAFRQPEG